MDNLPVDGLVAIGASVAQLPEGRNEHVDHKTVRLVFGLLVSCLWLKKETPGHMIRTLQF